MYTLLAWLPVIVTVTLSVIGVISSSPSTTTNSTFVKLALLFSKSAAAMPTGYSPASVPLAVHAAVGVSETFVSTA